MYYPMYFDPTYINVYISADWCRDLPDRISEDEFHIQQIFQSKESFRYDRKRCCRADPSQGRTV